MNLASAAVGSVAEINPIGQQWHHTQHVTTSSGGTTPYLPRRDLLGNSEDYYKICVPLYRASSKGDWTAADKIFKEHQDRALVEYGINENYDTALHVAASSESTEMMENFVQNLVNEMTNEQLELPNKNSNTALCLAAAAGNVNIVKIMLERHSTLVDIPGSQGMMPLYMASLLGQRDMVNHIYDNSKKMSGDIWTHEKRSWVLQKCVEAELFDIALRIVDDTPALAGNGSVLGVLAKKTDAFMETIPPTWFRSLLPLKIAEYKILDAVIQISDVLIQRLRSSWPGILSPETVSTERPTNAMKLLRIVWANIIKLPKDEIDDIIDGIQSHNQHHNCRNI